MFEIYDYRIRAIYGIDGRMNAIHGSDNPALAEKEIKFFFPTGILDCHSLSQIS
jgi:nucleoside diphosphate kinase